VLELPFVNVKNTIYIQVNGIINEEELLKSYIFLGKMVIDFTNELDG
jgi:hypothetical protein